MDGHPSAARLAVRLVSMVGLTMTEADLARAAKLDEAAAALMGATTPPALQPDLVIDITPVTLDSANYTDTTGATRLPVDPTGPLATPSGYAEALRVATTASADLAAAHDRSSSSRRSSPNGMRGWPNSAKNSTNTRN